MKNSKLAVYILSDATGETATMIARAALVHYADYNIEIVRCKNIRDQAQIEPLLTEVQARKGIVVFTFVDLDMRHIVLRLCKEREIAAIDILGPLLQILDQYAGSSQRREVGRLRTVDERYYRRIEAIEFTVKHDDGKHLSELDQADIVLVGISRTSKTPLSVFLSHKGWKVANIPLVVDCPLPNELFEIDQKRIVGLLIDAETLYRIRRNRIRKFGHIDGGDYATMAYIHREIEHAMGIFRKNKMWPVFDVSERALEETASEITRIICSRMGLPDDILY